jgi:hypothetical protein
VTQQGLLDAAPTCYACCSFTCTAAELWLSLPFCFTTFVTIISKDAERPPKPCTWRGGMLARLLLPLLLLLQL